MSSVVWPLAASLWALNSVFLERKTFFRFNAGVGAVAGAVGVIAALAG